MTEHDPMCPYRTAPWDGCAYCDLIARVREDERSNNFTPDDHADAMSDAYAKGRSDALTEARRAVRDECFHDEGEWCIFVAAIEALHVPMSESSGHDAPHDDPCDCDDCHAAIDALRGDA